jgi:RNA recognition motif-containing protein
MPDVTTSSASADAPPQRSRGYGFIRYESPESAEYALRLFSGHLTLFGRPVRVQLSGKTLAAFDAATTSRHAEGGHSGLQPEKPQQQQEQQRLQQQQQEFYDALQAVQPTGAIPGLQ